jgi:calcineurin-like phosphoesterase family protein
VSALLALACLGCPAWAESGSDSTRGSDSRPWKFAVFGDTRDAVLNTPTGISPLLSRLAEGIAAEHPALVLHIGDLVNGYHTDARSPVRGRYNEMFVNWKNAVRPIFDFDRRAGIPLYVVRGNHEDGKLTTDAQLKAAYVEHVGRLMPQNGPPKERGLTYSVSHRAATFIALDQYSYKAAGIVRGHVNQSWLDATLGRDDKPFRFVFGHVPAYRVSNAHGAPFPDLYDFPRHRRAFWSSLQRAGVPIYFCGHVHFYARVTKDGTEQVVIGNGGADLVDFRPEHVDSSVTLEYPRHAVNASEMSVGYLILTVDEASRTVGATQKLWNAAASRWEVGDTFTAHVRGSTRRE